MIKEPRRKKLSSETIEIFYCGIQSSLINDDILKLRNFSKLYDPPPLLFDPN